MPDSINDPHHWLDRAPEVRALSENMQDVQARAIMLRLASGKATKYRLSEQPGQCMPTVVSRIFRTFGFG